MFERWWQLYKIRMALTAIVLFIVSGVMSCQEIRYLVVGKTVDAMVTKDVLERNRYDDEGTVRSRTISYRFMDGEMERRESAEVPVNWQRPAGTTVKVQYIAGHEILSRLAGQHHWGWVMGFVVTMLLAGVGVVVIAREK